MQKKYAHFLSLTLLSLLVVNMFGSNIFELPKLHFLAVMLGIALLILVFSFFKNKGVTILWNKYVVMGIGAWVVSLLASTVFSIAQPLSIWGSYDRVQGLFSHLVYLSYFIIFLHLFQEKENREIFFKYLMGIASVTAIHAIAQRLGFYLFFEGASHEFLGRSFALLGHPNFLGQFILFPIWISLYLLFTSKKKLLPLLAVLLFVATLLATENRGSLLGLFVGIGVCSLITIKSRKLRISLVIGGVALFALFIFFIAPSTRSLTTRLYLWKGALQLIPDHPIFGSGLETFRLVFQKVSSPEFFELEQLYSIADRAHNELIDLVVMQGRYGLGVYVGIIAATFLSIFRTKNLRKNILLIALTGALSSILVANFFSFSMVVNYMAFVAILALIYSQIIKFKKTTLHPSPQAGIIFGVIFGVAIFLFVNSYRTISADNKFYEGTNLIYGKQVAEGITMLEDAIAMNPNQGDIFYQISDILFVIGKEMEDTELLEHADKVLEYAGGFTGHGFRYNFAKGRVNGYLKNFDIAEEYFVASHELAPINPIIMKEWGVMYYLEGDYTMAIEKIEEFLSLIPDYWKWRIDLDTHTKEEQEKYRLFMKHAPDLWDVFGYLAKSYEGIGGEVKAKYYNQYIKEEGT